MFFFSFLFFHFFFFLSYSTSKFTSNGTSNVYIITVTNSYILEENFNLHLKSIQKIPTLQIKKIYNSFLFLQRNFLESSSSFSSSFPSYSISLNSNYISLLQERNDIKYIEVDQIININDCITQKNPDWGLSRINQRGSFEYDSYAYESNYSGYGVNIYIIDTGIYCENDDFVNKVAGTCTYGIDVIDGSNIDGNGHGTHCAGTAAGHKFGVAKEANLIAVRVLNNLGTGSTSGIIEGINWMVDHAQTTGNASVANLSLGGSYSASLNSATAAAVLAGISVMVAAGNDNRDACNFSPSSTDIAVTVGATDDNDQRASYSNYGPCLDLFGPGSAIESAYIGSPSATATLSGTSMATPHIAGIAAVYQSIYNFTLTPTQVTDLLISQATKDVIYNVNGTRPIGDDNSPNLLGYVHTCNGTKSNDDSGIFHSTKSAFRALSVIFLCFSGFELGLGTYSLKLPDETNILTIKTGFLNLLMQCILLPIVAMVLITLIDYKKEYELAILIVAISPSGVVSNVVSNVCKLNPRLSVVLSFFSNMISIATIPILILIWVTVIYKLDNDIATYSWNRVIIALAGMIILTSIGFIIRLKCKNCCSKLVDFIISLGTAILFTIIMILGVAIYEDDIRHASRSLWATAFLLQIFGGFSSWVIGLILRIPFLDVLSLSIDSGSRGYILSIALLSFAFHSSNKEELMIYPLIYGIIAIINLIWVVPLYRFVSWIYTENYQQSSTDNIIIVDDTTNFASLSPSSSSSQYQRQQQQQQQQNYYESQERSVSLPQAYGREIQSPLPTAVPYDNNLSKALIAGDEKEYIY